MNWIAIYFVIGYIKLYMKRFQGSAKANLICLFTGIFGNIAMTLITNVLGLNIGFFSDKLTYWCSNFSPFTAMIGISSLNLALRVKFSSGFINRAAGLSMLVYIIHENILVRSYFRPLIFVKIYEKFGYSYILLWVFGIAAAVFVVSLLISFIYSITLRPIVSRAADRLYCLIKKPFDMTIDALMKITSL